MRMLVTGAGGFIGSFLCKTLVAEGHDVTGLTLAGEKVDHLEEQGVRILFGDLTDPKHLQDVSMEVDVVFHLAARVTDWGPRKAFYAAIYDTTKNLLHGSVGKAGRFVYVSSVAACGMGRHLNGHREEDPVYKSGLPYNDAKLDAERLVWKVKEDKGLAATVIRPTNVTGPGSIWVRDIVERYLNSKVPLIDNGRHSASLIYVENLVDGMVLAGTQEVAAGKTYHFRDDWKVTWKQYVEDLGDMVGKKPAFNLPYKVAWPAALALDKILTPLGVRPPATRQAVALMGRNLDIDTSKARRELGWKTRVSYEEAMQRIRQWVLDHMLKP